MVWQARTTWRYSGVKKVALLIGLAAVLLGGLWLLQGIGVVHLRPILCFADCEPLQGPSTTWAVIGAVVLAAGAATVWWSLKRHAG
jgi:hypothetical protein